MTSEELKALIQGTVKTEVTNAVKSEVAEAIKPLEATQRKYAGLFDPNGQPIQQTENKGEEVEPGIRLARCAKLAVLAKGDLEKALFIAKGGKDINEAKAMYPHDKVLQGALEKALSVTSPADGGFLVPEVLANEVIPLLYSKTVVMESGARKLDMPNGNLSIPRLQGGATSYYQGENKPATKSQQKFENLTLRSKKLTTLVPTSNDLIRNATVSADAIVRDDMMNAMRLKMDWAALFGTGTEYTPLGIKNTPGIVKQSAGAIIGADDPAIMRAVLKSKNLPMTSVGWVFNSTIEGILYNLKTTTGAYIYRAEMNTGKLLGYPYLTTEQISVGGDSHGLSDVFFGDWSEFIVGEEVAFEMSASTEATYDDGTGTLVSAYSNDQTIIKVLAKHDFGLRHAPAFLVYTFWTK